MHPGRAPDSRRVRHVPEKIPTKWLPKTARAPLNLKLKLKPSRLSWNKDANEDNSLLSLNEIYYRPAGKAPI